MKSINKARFTLRQVVIMLTIIFLGIAVISYGAVTIPNTFNAGQTISSGEVNANFTAVANQMPAVKTVITNDVTLGSNYNDILSITISAPGDGNVFISANGYVQTTNVTTTIQDSCIVGVTNQSDGTPFDGNLVDMHIGNNFDTTHPISYSIPYHVETIYTVSKGSHTFYLTGHKTGDAVMRARGNRLTAMFIPNALP
ncbi:MAG: hypothetical protein V1874_02820 [Spirochaetota bacterium]